MLKKFFSGLLLSMLLICSTCFAEVQPKDLGLTWLTSDESTGYFVKNLKVDKKKTSIKGDFYLWVPARDSYFQYNGKMDFPKQRLNVLWAKEFSIDSGSVKSELEALNIYGIKTGQPAAVYSFSNSHMAVFAKILAKQYNIPYEQPPIRTFGIENFKSSAAVDTMDTCTSVTGELQSSNVVAYTCRFSSGNIYNFAARVGLKGVFAYTVISGTQPACFSNRENETKVRELLFQAAREAGWQPPYAG